MKTLLATLAAVLLLATADLPALAAQAWVSLGGPGGSVAAFDPTGGTPLVSYSTPPGASDVLLSPDGSRLIVGTTSLAIADIRPGAPSLIAVLDAASGATVRQFAMPGSVVQMVRNAAGDRIYATGTAADGTTLLMSLDLNSGATASVPVANTSAYHLYVIGLSVDGSTLFVPTAHSIAFFDAATLAPTGTLALPSSAVVAPPLVTPDGKLLLVAAADAQLYAIDLATRAITGQVAFPATIASFGDALSPDGRTVYVSAGTLSAIDVASMTVSGSVALGQTNPHRLGISPDGQTLYATDLTFATTTVVDASTLNVLRTLQHIAPPWAVAVRPNGQVLVLNENANRVARIDTSAPGALGSFPVGNAPGPAVGALGKLFVPEVANLALQKTPAAPTPALPVAVNLIAVDSAAAIGSKVYANEGSVLRVISARREELMRTMLLRVPTNGGVVGTALKIAAAGDGSALLASYVALALELRPTDGGLIRVDARLGTQQRLSSFPFIPSFVASDRVGQYAYATGYIGRDQLGRWDLVGRRFVQSVTIAGAPSYVALATSADGATLLAVDEHGALDFIDTATMQRTASLPLGTRPNGVAVSPDGRQALITDGTSNTLAIVDLASRRVIHSIDVGAPSNGALFAD